MNERKLLEVPAIPEKPLQLDKQPCWAIIYDDKHGDWLRTMGVVTDFEIAKLLALDVVLSLEHIEEDFKAEDAIWYDGEFTGEEEGIITSLMPIGKGGYIDLGKYGSIILELDYIYTEKQ